MTRKKLRKAIIIGIVMFYIVASGLMLSICEFYQERQNDRTISNLLSADVSQQVTGNFEDVETDTKEKSDAVARTALHYYGRLIRGSYKYPFSIALQDIEGNIMYLSDNYLYWYSWGDDVYVSLDDYLTEEIKKELKEVTKRKYNALIDEMRLFFDGEKYIPVQVDFKGQGSHKDYKKTVKFSDYEVNKVIDNNPISATIHLHELGTEFYNRPYYNMLRDLIDKRYEQRKDDIDEGFGEHIGAGYSAGDGYCVGDGDLAIGEGYRLYFAFRYTPYLVTLFSEDYQTMVMLLAIMFLVAGFIFYIMCSRVLEKSRKLDEARNTFISGASHELKTPLAVIQNQCECIMENIAPEKNEEYVKSIYDEALRMNGIVSSLLSYSRISQLTSVEKEKCNLSELLKEEIANYSTFAENNGVTITADIDDDIYAECNAQMMKIAFGNYISNAIIYSVGDKKVHIRLWKKYNINMTITNPADKENADIASEAWNEFSRGDASRQRKGVSIGMGLPICKKIFELHGFRGYSSFKDGNITFSIYM